jgi:nicotinamide riboside kinase
LKIALLGAESTGKTELANQLTQHFLKLGKTVSVVPEYLRSWCAEKKRTPRQTEQLVIATEQARQINSTATGDVLIADTTALTIAVYSDFFFKDTTIYEMALSHQKQFDATLLMGLDLPWVADGFQRDGEHTREAVDDLLRAALARGNIDYHVVYGKGEFRLHHALRCLNSENVNSENVYSENAYLASQNTAQRLRNWVCERCSDPECEHRLFTELLKK